MSKSRNLTAYMVQQVKKGDEQAAHQLYNTYAKAMYNTLIRICSDEDDAKDALQEAFIKAFEKINTLKNEAGFGAWLKQIVVNTGLQVIRKKRPDYEDITNLPDPAEDIQTEIEFTENQVHEAIKRLPEKSRLVVTLFLIEGFSHKEIARKMGITESTSKTQYKRGKELLKQYLKSMKSHG